MALIVLFLCIAVTVAGKEESFAQSDNMSMSGSMSSMNMTGDSAVNATRSPVIYTLPNSGIQIKMSWLPESINTNDTTKFTFEFIDRDTEQHLQNVSFSVHMSLDGTSMGHAHEATAPQGIVTVEQKFDAVGSLMIIVESIKVNGTLVNDVAQFGLSVVPEFPVSTAIITALAIGGSIAAFRLVWIKP